MVDHHPHAETGQPPVQEGEGCQGHRVIRIGGRRSSQSEPDVIIRDADGKPLTVRYEAVNAMLLNEFLKAHSTERELNKEVAALLRAYKKSARSLN